MDSGDHESRQQNVKVVLSNDIWLMVIDLVRALSYVLDLY
jgi:hypothetical protein